MLQTRIRPCEAEHAYRFELGVQDVALIGSGHWDSLRSGLLSGEQLYLDLKRLELAYLDKNVREYEITRHVSLVLHDPAALITLKETGSCEFKLPESMFNMDFPSHYMRRIKSVSVTIACVTGPYTGIYSTLTLLKSTIYTSSTSPATLTNFSALESIATSHAQNDSGVFELSFRDERYLPFEGAGADSEWRLELPKISNAFDFETITTVMVRVNYTAKEGGERLKSQRLLAAEKDQQDLARLFSLRHEFPDAWHSFTRGVPGSTTQAFTVDVAERLSYRWRGRKLKIKQWTVFLKLTEAGVKAVGGTFAKNITVRKDADPEPAAVPTDSPLNFPGLPAAVVPLDSEVDAAGKWQFEVKGLPVLTRDLVSDIYLLCGHSAGALRA